jgi:glyoxylase I family protein
MTISPGGEQRSEIPLRLAGREDIATLHGGTMNQEPNATSSQAAAPIAHPAALDNFAHVRYQVTDIDRSIAFYTQQLGFALEQKVGAVFASVTLGRLRLILSGPGSSGARPLPDGQQQRPGGWNRILIYVDQLDGHILRLKQQNIRFRNAVEAGPGGKQIQLDDPDGNPIELHEALNAG